MSITFTVANSPRHTVTHTYGEEGDGETDTYEETVLPSCNFANSSACSLVGVLNTDLLTEHGLVGTWDLNKVVELRERIQDSFADRLVPHHMITRMLSLYTVLDAAVWYGQPVSYS